MDKGTELEWLKVLSCRGYLLCVAESVKMANLAKFQMGLGLSLVIHFVSGHFIC